MPAPMTPFLSAASWVETTLRLPKRELPARTAKEKLGLDCQDLNPSGDVRSACLLPFDFEPSAQPSVLLPCLVFRFFFFDAWFALSVPAHISTSPSFHGLLTVPTLHPSSVRASYLVLMPYIYHHFCVTVSISPLYRYAFCGHGALRSSTISLPIASLTPLSVVYVPDRSVGLLLLPY
ncbi:hypothetical protein BJV78DRAFT_580866 [Lactifluus subvellereus]|nr:hypothetical protein BJV78DRAFT_580866 [Lactifluus subvellereus]